MTHFNYSRFVASAILSVLEQSVEAWELIIVDDHSSEAEFRTLAGIVSDFADDRISLLRNDENLGQICAIFRGLAAARGDFVALLDPDDLYEPTFLETMSVALLNPVFNVGVATCEMGVFNQNTGVLTRHSTSFRMRAVNEGRYEEYAANLLLNGYSDYFPPWKTGWIWSATSGMMFRRAVLEVIAPKRPIDFTRFEGDSYCAIGCHMITGTLFVDQMLSWRRVHDSNTAKSPIVVFDDESRMRPEFTNRLAEVKLALAETILGNASLVQASGADLASSVIAHIGYEGASIVAERDAVAKNAIFQHSFGGV